MLKELKRWQNYSATYGKCSDSAFGFAVAIKHRARDVFSRSKLLLTRGIRKHHSLQNWPKSGAVSPGQVQPNRPMVMHAFSDCAEIFNAKGKKCQMRNYNFYSEINATYQRILLFALVVDERDEALHDGSDKRLNLRWTYMHD